MERDNRNTPQVNDHELNVCLVLKLGPNGKWEVKWVGVEEAGPVKIMESIIPDINQKFFKYSVQLVGLASNMVWRPKTSTSPKKTPTQQLIPLEPSRQDLVPFEG